MLGNTVKKVTWMAKATTTVVGLAIMLALVLGVATTALAGTGIGARFDLGKTNTVNAVSKLVGSVVGPSLQIDNNSADFGATALRLEVEPGRPPMTVSSEAKVVNLNADRLDDQEATAFVGATRPMSVVAAGTVSSDGEVEERTSNVTVQKDGTGRYLIDISGVSYFFADFVAVATSTSANRVVHTNSIGGDLVVETQDLATRARVDGPFSFVVYDAG
jgi:hypothetical protein